jgi:hypothetical protein
MAQRLKGQDCTITIMKYGAQVATLTDIRNFTLTPNFDKLEEGYLGETTNRFDEIFKGLSFDMEAHVEESGFVDFITAVKDRATRRTPGTVINVFATLNFPNGSRARIVIRDCFFADMPFNVGSRSDYGSVKISGGAADFEKIG